MNRADLLDNLCESRDRRELVTLTLRPVTGQARAGDVVVTGRVLAVAEGYTSRRALVAVLEQPGRMPKAIGLSMIKDLRVCAARPTPARG